jgi:hypothetical protein
LSSSPKFTGQSATRGSAEIQTETESATKNLIPELLDLRPPIGDLSLPHVQARRDRGQLKRASWAFTTRRVPISVADSVIPAVGKPETGDLILARVDALGHHRGLQLANGRRRSMFVGDEIVVAYGNRYASSQFKSFVPETLGPCHLVAGGGIASRAVSWHSKISRGPTHITPLGLVANSDGQRLNLRDFGLPLIDTGVGYQPTTIAIVGTSMDAGKTETAAYLARGMIKAGLRVAYAKITGTGAGGDTWLLKDAGADPVLDFTDAGLPTTYLASPDEVARVLTTLIAHTSRSSVDTLLLEIADGVFQGETAALLASTEFAQLTGGIVMAARDSMGASAGATWLSQHGTPLLALSGVLTSAPLQIEEAKNATGLPIYGREALATAAVAMELASQAQNHQLDIMRLDSTGGSATDGMDIYDRNK